MGALLHRAHAAERPECEAQAAEADAALFATMGQAVKPRPKLEAAADILGRLANEAQRIHDAAYKLCPDNDAPFTSGSEQRTYTVVFDCAQQMVAALSILQGIEKERADEKNDPPSLGHYPHLKPAGRMVVA